MLERAEGYTNIQSSFDVGEINDVVISLRRIAIDIHQKIMERYADNPTDKYILSAGGVFLVSFTAARGKVRNMLNITSLEGALERLMKELSKPDEDPLNLDSATPQELQDLLDELEASRASRKRTWENLAEIRWVLKDTTGIELPPPARKTIDLCTGREHRSDGEHFSLGDPHMCIP